MEAGTGKDHNGSGDINKDTTVSPTQQTSESQPNSSQKTFAKTCVNCQKDLTRTIRITCAECKATESMPAPCIVLCIECFSVGAELGTHKKTHSYSVSDCLAYPLVYDPSKGAPLSEALASTVGGAHKNPRIGTPPPNIVSSVLSDWTVEEDLLLLEGIESFGMGNWKDIAEHIGTKSEKKCEAHYFAAYLNTPTQLPEFVEDVIQNKGIPPPESGSEKSEVTQSSRDGSDAPNKTPKSPKLEGTSGNGAEPKLVGTELAGYMPLRGDFDVEYDNDAEIILADMKFEEDDSPTERALKLKVIEIYNTKLDERARRKKFVIEYGLLDYKKHQQMERKRPKEERELIAQMRPFARFHSRQEHEELIDGLITAMRLRKQIVLLQEYRRNGVKTLAEAEVYEQEKRKREAELAMQKQREDSAYLYGPGRVPPTGKDRASRYRERTSGAFEDEQRNELDSVKRARVSEESSSAISSYLVDGAPGAHLLTPTERELCAKLKLLPKHYLVIKDVLVRECYRMGFLTPETAKQIVKLDVKKSEHIYDFFVTCGWVQREPSSLPATDDLTTCSAASCEAETIECSPPRDLACQESSGNISE